MNRTLNWVKDRLSAFWLISDDRDELIAELADVKQQLRIAVDALSIAHEEWAIEREKLVKANEMYQRQHDRLLKRVRSIRKYAADSEKYARQRFEQVRDRHERLINIVCDPMFIGPASAVEEMSLWSAEIGKIECVFPESEDDVEAIKC